MTDTTQAERIAEAEQAAELFAAKRDWNGAYQSLRIACTLRASEPTAQGWRPISEAPKDGTPLLLFARALTATAPVPVIGWFLRDLGWIEACFVPNKPVGIEPTHWMPRPSFPAEGGEHVG